MPSIDTPTALEASCSSVGGVVQLAHEHAPGPVDDILGFGEVKVHRDGGALADDHGLLAVGLGVCFACGIAVAEREQHQPTAVEGARTEVRNVPAEPAATNLVGLRAYKGPLFRVSSGRTGGV